MARSILSVLLAFSFLQPASRVAAQDSPEYPVYIVQSGDSLSAIAQRFGISINQIIEANDIANPNAIPVGSRLLIPGLDGVHGILTSQVVALGENLENFNKRYQFPPDLLTRLNRITSSAEIYAGTNLIIPIEENVVPLKAFAALDHEQSLLELAVKENRNLWTILERNQLSSPCEAFPGVTLYTIMPEAIEELNPISPLISKIDVKPLPLYQGNTTVIRLTAKEALDLKGSIGNLALTFYPTATHQYVALQGIPALAETGLVEFNLSGIASDGKSFDYAQTVILGPGAFSQESVIGVDSLTVDPETIEQEERLLVSLVKMTSPERFWDESFRWPVDEPCLASRFGNRRSYNEGAYFYYHTGLDFTVCANNLNIYAAAPGKVIFAEFLPIKGNFTVIDHGWGIYSGYAHQSEILVSPGDFVESGQLIGIIGNTGRSLGPHLHWEIWANGVPVNPIEWVENPYP